MDEDEIMMNPFEEDDVEDETNIYRTYRMDIKNKRIIGMVDGLEAAAQSMFKALQTRRFIYLIYDEQYGCDIYNKIGNINLTPGYLNTDIPIMIEDTFLNDESIRGIEELYFEMVDRDSLCISIIASSIFGDIEFEGVIKDG